MPYFHLTLRSSNAKTGPIPVSTTSGDTCPPSCGVRAECYAKSGPLALHWAKVTSGERGTDFATFCATIAALPDGTLWRHNQSGDLPGTGDMIDAPALSRLSAANKGKRGFTYTHKPMTRRSNLAAVRKANADGFTINLSGDDVAHADRLAALGIAPVAVVLPSTAKSNFVTPAGNKVIICPATQRDDVTCATCQMCARQRSTIIGFPAHGSGARRINIRLVKATGG